MWAQKSFFRTRCIGYQTAVETGRVLDRDASEPNAVHIVETECNRSGRVRIGRGRTEGCMMNEREKRNMGARRRNETAAARPSAPCCAHWGGEELPQGAAAAAAVPPPSGAAAAAAAGDATPPRGSRRRSGRTDAARPGRTAFIHKYALLLPLGGARVASPPPPARTPGRAPSRRRTGARGWRARTPRFNVRPRLPQRRLHGGKCAWYSRFPRGPGTPGGQGAAVMLYDTHARPGRNGHARVRSASGPRPFLQILSYAPRPVRVRSASAAVFPRGNRKVARGAGVARTPKGYTFGMSGAGMARAFPVPQGLGGGIMQDPQSHWLCGSSPALAAGVH
eukprot:gene23515-biopygen20824